LRAHLLSAPQTFLALAYRITELCAQLAAQTAGADGRSILRAHWMSPLLMEVSPPEQA